MSSWGADTSANRYVKTFIKGFLDMSGGDLYVRHGDTHLYGNADISGDLDVSGNTVIDGSLTLGGNLIVDGDISGNFATGSIPAAAISGGVGSAITISEIDSGNNVSGTVTDVETIRFDTDSGFAVDDLGSGAVKIKMNSTFKTWSVSGEDDLVASGLDTMNFANDSNISISTSEPNGDKTLTISAPSMVTTDTEQTISSTKTFSNIVTSDISANGHISGTDISASDIEASGTAVIGSTLGVTGATTLSSTLGVTGDATMSSGIIVSGDASLTDVNVSGAATVGSTLGVTGNATMSSGLIVSGDASLSDVNVAGNANVSTNFGVTGSATFSNTISVTNKASLLGDLAVAGDTSLNGVYAAGNASVVGTLGVTGVTTMSSGLIVSGDASLTNLNVSGSANFENGITTDSLTVGNNAVEINGDTNTISTTSGNLTVSAAEKTVFTTDVSVNSGVAMSGGLTVGTVALSNNTLSTTTGDLTIAPASGNKVTISANLTVDGSVNFTGDFIKTDTNVQVTEQLDISNDGTGPAMIVTQYGAQPVAEFYDDANLTMVIKDGGDVSLAAGINVDGTATMNSGMVVSGDASLADVNVSGTATVGSTLDVTGATTLSSALGVTGDATMSAGLIVSGDASLAGVNASGAATIGSTLGVTGATTLSSTLAISESGAGTAASATGGTLTLSHTETNGTGKNSIVFKSSSNSDNYGYIEFVDDGAGGGTQNGILTIGIQDDPTILSTINNNERIDFTVAGTYSTLYGYSDSTGTVKGSQFLTDSIMYRGIDPRAYNLNTFWGTTMNYYDTVNNTNRYTMYQYFNHTHSDVHDMALVGYNAGTGSGVNPDGNLSYGYMYRSKNAPNKFISFQTRGLRYGDNDVVDGMRLGVNAVPGYTYDFAVGGKSHFGNDIDISGGNLDVTGTTTVGSTLGVTGATTLSSTLGVTGATTLSSTLGVTGNTTMSSGLIVSGDASLAGVNASGAAVVGSTLDVTGATTLSSTLGVTGNATMSSGLIVSGDSSLAGLNVSGAAVFENGITTDSITVGNNTVEINGDTNTISTTSGNLTVSAASKSVFTTDASFNDNISVENGVTASSLVSDSLTVGSTTLSNNVIGTSAGSLTITPASGSHVTISSNLTVDGSINFSGNMIQTDTMVRVTDQIDISNDGTGPAIIVTQHGDQPVATFYDDANLSMIIKNGGDVSLAGGINIDGAATAGSTLGVTGAATMSSTLGVTGATTLNSTLGVTDDATMSAGLIVSGDASLAGVNASGAATMSSTLGVTGTTTLSSTLGVTGDATMSSGLIVSGDASLSDMNVSGAATVGSTLGVTGNATMSAGLIVSGDASLVGVNASGAATMGSTLGVTGAATLSSTLGVTGDATMSAGLIVSGDASLAGVNASGAATLSSTLGVTGATTLSNTLGVTGDATMSSGLIVSGDASLTDVNVAGNANVSTNLGVTGAATFSDTISVTNKTSLLGDLAVTGDTSLNGVYAAGNASVLGTMSVTGNAALSSGMTVASDASLTRLNVSGTSKFEDNITAVSISTGSGNLTINPADRLVVSKDSSFSGGVTVADEFVAGNTTINNNTIGTTSGGLTITPATGGNVTITSNLTVDGSVNFTGDFIKTDTVVRITEQVDVSNDGTGPAMRVTQYGVQPVAEFYDDANLTMVIKDGGDVSMAAGLDVVGETTINSGLVVSGDASFVGVNASGAATMGSTLGVTGDATMSAGLIVSGDASLAGVNASGAAIMGSTLGVTGATTLSSTLGVTGDATVSSGLIVSGDASLAGVNASGATTLSSTLGVTGATTLSSTLGVTGATTLSSTLGVTSDATMSSGLIVSGDASLSGVNASGAATMGSTLGVTGATTLSSTLGVTGDATMSSGLIVSGDASLSGVNASGAATMGSTLGVTGATTLSSTLGVTGDATISSGLIVSGDASLAGVNASGAATMGSTLGVTGATTLSSTLGVTGATTLSSTLGVTGATTLSSTLGVTGDATMSSGLIVSGDASLAGINASGAATMSSTLGVTGTTTLSSTLGVTGDATMSSGLIVSGDASLTDVNVSGTAVVGSTLAVTGGTFLSSTLAVTGDATMSSGLTVSSDSSLAGLNVSGAAVFENGITTDSITVGNNTVEIDGATNTISTTSGNLTVSAASKSVFTTDASFNNSISVENGVTASSLVSDSLTVGSTTLSNNVLGTSAGGLTITPASGSHVTITSNLTVDGSINFTGDMIKTDTMVRVTDQLDISNDGTGPAMIVTQHGVQPVAEFYDDANLSMVIKNGGDVSLAGGINIDGAATAGSTLDVTGAATMSSTLGVTGVTTLSSTLGVTGDATMSSGLIVSGDASLTDVNVSGAATMGSTLGVTGNATMSSGLIVSGDASLTDVSVSGAATVGSTLGVTGNATMSSGLIVSGDASFGASAYVGSKLGVKTTSPVVTVEIGGTDGIRVPAGTAAQRPVANNAGDASDYLGTIRYNTDTDAFEGYSNSTWSALGAGGGSSITNSTDDTTVSVTDAGDSPSRAIVFESSGSVAMVINSDGDVSMNNGMNIDGATTMNSTLAITESGAGTAASATGGSITLSHATSDGTGKNSIVFKSASDSGSDYGYIQYHDDGAGGSGSQNGALTIGVQNDAIDWGQSTTNADRIKFDVAGASALLEGRANSTGGNLASLLDVGSGYFRGIYSDAFDISDAWNVGALDDYSSTEYQDRYALYQYFDNADDNRQDMALVGFNGATGDAVDGSKPYGYMYRCSRTPNRFIAFQTLGLIGSTDSRGMKLGVSAYPGADYEFAVGGKSHFGNDIDISGGNLDVTGTTTVGSTLGVTGDATMSSGLIVSGDASLTDVNVSGAAVVGSTLGVTGATTMSSTLGVTGATTLSSTLGVSDAATLSSSLAVTGATTLSSTLGVTGATTLSSTLGVSDATTLSSTLGVTGATTLSSTLGVTGDATFSGDVQTSSITTSSGNLVITPGGTGKVTIASDLTVDGSVNFTGDFIKTDTIVRITEQVDVSNDGTGPAMRVTQHGDQPVAEFYDDATLAMVVKNGGDVSLAGNLTVAGAGMFTGSTDINTTTAPSGVYLGNNGSVGSQDSIIQMTSDGDYSIIDFTRNGASGTAADREGRILFANGNHTTIPYQLSISPRDSNGAALTLKAVASGSIDADVDGMVTLRGGVRSDDRNYESADYWNASLNCGNDYRTWGDYRNAAFLYVDSGYRSQDDLLLTGHTSGAGGTNSYGYNLYSKGAVQDGVTDQGLCIQTSYDGSSNFRLGLGDRPGTYQFSTTGDVKVGGKLDVDGSLNVTDATTLSSTLGVTDATTLSSTLGVTGATSLSSTLGVTGATTLSSTLGVTGAATMSSTLGVTGAATMSSTLGVTGAATMSSTLGVTGATTLSSTLGVTDATTLSSTLGVTGATTLSSTLGVTGATTMNNTLAIDETGAGTAASATGGTLTLSHTQTNGTGKNSIVFKSSSNSDNYGYIEFVDDGAGSGTQNGILTIGIQDDTSILGAINNNERMDFTVAGTYSTLYGYSNSTGTVKGSQLMTDSIMFRGIDPRAYNLNTVWGTTMDYYDAASNTNRYTMYQYFDHTHINTFDMALVGYNAGSSSGVNPDGNLSYGYMYRSRCAPNKFISFQTRGLRYGDNDVVDGMRLGVNAVPGYTYDFAVGGKSYLGNDVDISGDLTVSNGAGIFTGAAQQYDTANTVGVYIGKNSGGSGYSTAQLVTGEDQGWMGFTHINSANAHEGLIVYYNSTSSTTPYQMEFHPNRASGDATALRLKYVSSGVLTATVDGDIRSTRNLDVSGSTVVDGNLTVNGTIYGTLANGAGQSSIFGTDVSMHADLDVSGTLTVDEAIRTETLYGGVDRDRFLLITQPAWTPNTGWTSRYQAGRPTGAGIHMGLHKYWYTDSGDGGQEVMSDATIDLMSVGDQRINGQINFWGTNKTHFAAKISSQGDHDNYGVSKLFIEGTRSDGTVESFAEFGMETVGNNQNTKIMKFYGSVTVNGSTVQTSDLTLKTDIETLESSLDKICRLRGVSYRMKEDYDASSIKQLGLIAQEVEVEYPELVLEMQKDIDRDGVNEKYKGLNYANLTAPMVEAIKELKDKNDALEAENTLLKSQMQDVLARLTALENK